MFKKHRPQLRFTGFDNEWEKVSLNKILHERNELSTETDEYPLMSFVQGEGVVPKGERYDRGFLVKSPDKKYKKTEFGDFIYSSNNLETGSIGFNKQGKAVISPVYSIFSSKDTLSSRFIGIVSARKKFTNEMIRFRQGVVYGQWRIHESDFLNIKLALPSNKEQENILALFQTLDELLSDYKDNLANYQAFKASMLFKMFPKVGQTTPEIRLDGFDGEWKEKKLGEVTERVQGNDGRMDLLTLTISAANGWMNQEDRFSQNIAGKEQKNYTLLKKGELSYNHGNSKLAKYGVVFELDSYEEALVPRVYHSFRVKDGLSDAKFIETMFMTKRPDRELGKLVSSGARMDGLLNINYDEFMGIKIILPRIEEQRAIGTFFSNLDNLISSYQDKITQLETLKKKLLQDMFV